MIPFWRMQCRAERVLSNVVSYLEVKSIIIFSGLYPDTWLMEVEAHTLGRSAVRHDGLYSSLLPMWFLQRYLQEWWTQLYTHCPFPMTFGQFFSFILLNLERRRNNLTIISHSKCTRILTVLFTFHLYLASHWLFALRVKCHLMCRLAGMDISRSHTCVCDEVMSRKVQGCSACVKMATVCYHSKHQKRVAAIWIWTGAASNTSR